MKVYLAGMFSTIALRKEQAAMLRSHGIEVTSRWIDENVPHNVETKDLPNTYHEETAVADIQDIDAADVFIMFVPEDKELVDATLRSASRGGRHFEMGYAYAGGPQEVLVCGPKENVFHHLPDVLHFETFEEILQFLVANL